MNSSKPQPILGCAVPLSGLRLHQDWLLEKHWDLEIMDLFWAAILNGDWSGLAVEVKKELDGFRGRLRNRPALPVSPPVLGSSPSMHRAMPQLLGNSVLHPTASIFGMFCRTSLRH